MTTTQPHNDELAIEDAMRLVSLRLPVTDYGRLRLLAKRLKVRESVALRLILHLALVRFEALFLRGASPEAVLPLLADLGRAARREGLPLERLCLALEKGNTGTEQLSSAQIRAALTQVLENPALLPNNTELTSSTLEAAGPSTDSTY